MKSVFILVLKISNTTTFTSSFQLTINILQLYTNSPGLIVHTCIRHLLCGSSPRFGSPVVSTLSGAAGKKAKG